MVQKNNQQMRKTPFDGILGDEKITFLDEIAIHEHAKKNFQAENTNFLQAVFDLEKIRDHDKWYEKFNHIFDTYLKNGATEEINVSNQLKKEIDSINTNKKDMEDRNQKMAVINKLKLSIATLIQMNIASSNYRMTKENLSNQFKQFLQIRGFTHPGTDESKNVQQRSFNESLLSLKKDINHFFEKKEYNVIELTDINHRKQKLQNQIEKYMKNLVDRFDDNYRKLNSIENANVDYSPQYYAQKLEIKINDEKDHSHKYKYEQLLKLNHKVEYLKDPENRKNMDISGYINEITELEKIRDEVIKASNIVQRRGLTNKFGFSLQSATAKIFGKENSPDQKNEEKRSNFLRRIFGKNNTYG